MRDFEASCHGSSVVWSGSRWGRRPCRRHSVASVIGVSTCFDMIASAPQVVGDALDRARAVDRDEHDDRRRKQGAELPRRLHAADPGIRTSIRMRSGPSSTARSIASSPDAASPTNSNCVEASTTVRTMLLNASWSSTARTPQRFVPPGSSTARPACWCIAYRGHGASAGSRAAGMSALSARYSSVTTTRRLWTLSSTRSSLVKIASTRFSTRVWSGTSRPRSRHCSCPAQPSGRPRAREE